VSRQLLESIRCENGEVLHLSYHQARLDSALKDLHLNATYQLKEHITPPDKALYRCRVLYDAQTLHTQYLPYTKRSIKKLQLIESNALNYNYKYADREALELLYAQRGEADDVLIVQDKLVTDTTIANIAFYDGKQWLTPQKPLLEGTTRARLLDEKKIVEAAIHVNELNAFTHFALLNAMIGFDLVKNGIISPLKEG